MTDTNFVPRHRAAVIDHAATPEVGAACRGRARSPTVHRRFDPVRLAIRQWPLRARLLYALCLFTLGWLLIMTPLFIDR